jgi:hypothetical protein
MSDSEYVLQAYSRLFFGQDVAEHEEQLDAYFLRTAGFWSVVSDESDLVLGAKGTGKSAIARYITSPYVAIDQLADVMVIPAFNVQGSVLFKRLSEIVIDDTEATFRDVFMAYMVGLLSNKLIQQHPQNYEVRQLKDSITRMGLLVEQPETLAVWKKVISRFRPKLTTSIEVGETGVPKLSGTADFTEVDPGEPNRKGDPKFGIEELEVALQLAYESLDLLNLRCWIVFDRLDEAFPDSRDLERAALRGLMRAHLDFCSYGSRLRTKLFLRMDVFDRITETTGFVNATHLRSSRISWDSDSIIHLVALRLNEGVDASRRLPILTPKERRNLCRAVLPQRIDGYDSLVWLLLVTVDATREFNPRNVLSLLRFAKSEALQIAMRESPERIQRFGILPARALMQGYKQLSRARMQDTIFAEAISVRQYVEALRGPKTVFSTEDLSRLFKLDGADLSQAISELRYAGFLRLDAGTYIVPPLYRPALFASVHKAEARLGASREDESNFLSTQANAIDPPVRNAMQDQSVETAIESRATTPSELSELSEPPEPPEPLSVTEGVNPSAESPSSPRPRQRRRRGRPKPFSARDEFIPTGQRSEIEHEKELAEEIIASLPSDDESISGNALRSEIEIEEQKDAPESTAGERRIESPGAQAVRQARALAATGDYLAAWEALYPNFTTRPGSIVTAADIAYGTGDRAIMQTALELLRRPEMVSMGAALGRIVSLSLVLGDDLGAQQAASQINALAVPDALIGITRFAGQVPGTEVEFWKRGLKALASETSSPNTLMNLWATLTTARVLAICRRTWERASPGDYQMPTKIVERIFSDRQWARASRYLLDYLQAFAIDPSTAFPPLVPYQVLSLIEVLDAMHLMDAGLRIGAISSLRKAVQSLEPIRREQFLEWSQFSSIVAEIAFARNDFPATRPPRRPRSIANSASSAKKYGRGRGLRTGNQKQSSQTLNLEELREFNNLFIQVLISHAADTGHNVTSLSVLGNRFKATFPALAYGNFGVSSFLELAQLIAATFGDFEVGYDQHGLPTASLKESEN